MKECSIKTRIPLSINNPINLLANYFLNHLLYLHLLLLSKVRQSLQFDLHLGQSILQHHNLLFSDSDLLLYHNHLPFPITLPRIHTLLELFVLQSQTSNLLLQIGILPCLLSQLLLQLIDLPLIILQTYFVLLHDLITALTLLTHPQPHLLELALVSFQLPYLLLIALNSSPQLNQLLARPLRLLELHKQLIVLYPELIVILQPYLSL